MKRVVIAMMAAVCLLGVACASKAPVNEAEQYRKSQEAYRQQEQIRASTFSTQLFQTGQQQYQAGRYEDAVASWRKAIAAGGPDWLYLAETNYNIGLAYVQMHRAEWAITEMEKAVAIRPDYYDAHFALSNLYIGTEQYEKAAASLKVCTDQRGDDASLFYNLGLSYLNAQMFPDAIGALSTALFLKPGDPQAIDALEIAHRAWGMALYQEGRYDEAIETFAVALSLKPDNGQTYYDLARCYLMLGRYDEAIETYRRAHAVAPDLAEAHRKAVVGEGRSDVLVEVAGKSRNDPEALTQIGDLYRSRGQFERAAQFYEQAILTAPDDADRYLKLARFYADNLGDRDRALRWYGAFLAMWPGDPRVATVRKEIARETAPPADERGKPEVAAMAAGLVLDPETRTVVDPESVFAVGSSVVRTAEVANLWGEHTVVKRLVNPAGKTHYEETIKKEFYVDRFRFVSRDRLPTRGVWRWQLIVDGEVLGTLDLIVR